MFKPRKVGWSDEDSKGLHEGEENHLKYPKGGWNGKEGSGNKDLKKGGGQAGYRDGCLKKEGGGWNPLTNYVIYIYTYIYIYIYVSLATGSYIQWWRSVLSVHHIHHVLKCMNCNVSVLFSHLSCFLMTRAFWVTWITYDHLWLCINIYIYTYTHTHIYIHTHTHTGPIFQNFNGCNYHTQSSPLSFEKIIIRNGWKWLLFRGCKQTKCLFFRNLPQKMHPGPQYPE